jgi:hypothetical protein
MQEIIITSHLSSKWNPAPNAASQQPPTHTQQLCTVPHPRHHTKLPQQKHTATTDNNKRPGPPNAGPTWAHCRLQHCKPRTTTMATLLQLPRPRPPRPPTARGCCPPAAPPKTPQQQGPPRHCPHPAPHTRKAARPRKRTQPSVMTHRPPHPRQGCRQHANTTGSKLQNCQHKLWPPLNTPATPTTSALHWHWPSHQLSVRLPAKVQPQVNTYCTAAPAAPSEPLQTRAARHTSWPLPPHPPCSTTARYQRLTQTTPGRARQATAQPEAPLHRGRPLNHPRQPTPALPTPHAAPIRPPDG